MSTNRHPSEEAHTPGISPRSHISHVSRHSHPSQHQRPAHFNNSFDQPTEPFECDVSAILPYDDEDDDDEDEDEEDEDEDEEEEKEEEEGAYTHPHNEDARETRPFQRGHTKVINKYLSCFPSCVTGTPAGTTTVAKALAKGTWTGSKERVAQSISWWFGLSHPSHPSPPHRQPGTQAGRYALH